MNITTFQFEKNQIRVIADATGDTWLLLRDVLQAININIRPADAKELIVNNLGDLVVENYPITDILGRKQEVIVVSEPAVNFLVSRSNTEIGKRLNRWIRNELLPSIRKTGSYTSQKPISPVNQNIEGNTPSHGKARAVQSPSGELLFFAVDAMAQIGFHDFSRVKEVIQIVPAEWRGTAVVYSDTGPRTVDVLTESGLLYFLGAALDG